MHTTVPHERTCRQCGQMETKDDSMGERDKRNETLYMAWSPDGRHIVTGTEQNWLTIFDTRKMGVVFKKKYRAEINAMKWDRQGKVFFLPRGDGTIELFKLRNL